uniref:Uncharacterized protein n=1 Tax=Molossus molossus TaxID=27622 RepID=A0A7J8JWB6_MOLMO|nr:hypothetical protein HJG59_008102 [Molossus molossus]
MNPTFPPPKIVLSWDTREKNHGRRTGLLDPQLDSTGRFQPEEQARGPLGERSSRCAQPGSRGPSQLGCICRAHEPRTAPPSGSGASVLLRGVHLLWELLTHMLKTFAGLFIGQHASPFHC